MKKKENDIIEAVKRNLRALSSDSGGIKSVCFKDESMEASSDRTIDLIAEVRTKEDRTYRLLFEVKAEGAPRYVRMAASELKSKTKNQADGYGVFATTFLSDEAKRVCRENDIGFIDMAGNCLFDFGNVYMSVEGRPNPYPDTRPLKNLFSQKSTRALRVLLNNPGRDWFVKELSGEAKISMGQTSKVKNRLLDYEFIEEPEAGGKKKFRLKSPEALLKQWAENYSYQDNEIRNFYSLDNLETIEEKLANYCEENAVPYAFTLTSGSAKIAPFLRYTRAFAYINDDVDQIAEALNFKEVSSGPNISLLLPYDEGVFQGAQKVQGAKVVSDVQLYLDLISYGERGEEAATFLLEQRLRKQW